MRKRERGVKTQKVENIETEKERMVNRERERDRHNKIEAGKRHRYTYIHRRGVAQREKHTKREGWTE